MESHTSLGDNRSSSNVVAASIQGKRQSLGRYSGQSGSVYVVGDMYVGRYRVRDPEAQNWIRKSLVIGPRKEMKKPEAKRKLKLMLDEMGINKDANSVQAKRSSRRPHDGRIPISSCANRHLRISPT